MDNMTQTPTEIVGASVEETPVTKPSQDQVNEALGLLGLALKALGKLGIITPLGGLCFLAGWLCLGLAAWRLG